MTTTIRLVAIAVILLIACDSGRQRRSAQSAEQMMSAALQQMRAGSTRPDSLESGAGSRDSLFDLLGRAIERKDTALVRRLLLTRAEFAWQFYPSSGQSRPPYELPADLLWAQLTQQSAVGMTYLFRRFGGGFEYLGYSCGDEPAIEGENRIWGPCAITFRTSGGDSGSARITGPVLEWKGRYSFISYTNDLD